MLKSDADLKCTIACLVNSWRIFAIGNNTDFFFAKINSTEDFEIIAKADKFYKGNPYSILAEDIP